MTALAKAILSVLKARGFEVQVALEAEILGCRDTAILEHRLTRAALVESIEELLG